MGGAVCEKRDEITSQYIVSDSRTLQLMTSLPVACREGYPTPDTFLHTETAPWSRSVRSAPLQECSAPPRTQRCSWAQASSARWSESPRHCHCSAGPWGGVVLRAHEEADLLRGRGGDVRRVVGRGGRGGGRFGDLPVAAVQVQGGERRQVHRLVAAGRRRRRAQALPQAGLTAGREHNKVTVEVKGAGLNLSGGNTV